MTYALTLIFMFWVFWRPQEWLWQYLYGLPILDAVVGFALAGLMIEQNEGRIRLPKEAPQLWLLLGLWLAAPISHIPHTYFVGMVNSILPVFKVCFFTFLLFIVVDRPLRLRLMVVLFVGMSAIMTVHAMLQVDRGYGFNYAPGYWIPQIGDRPAHLRTCFFGIFQDPNDLGQFLAASVPLCFCFTRKRNALSFIVGCALTAFILTGLFSTNSRGGIVALAACIATRTLFFFPDRKFLILLCLGMLGGLALCPFSGPFLDMSAHERVVFWGYANYAFKRNPMFGVGYEMFWIIVPKSRAAHNAFVACYTELGLFGYWFWFGLIQLGIVGAWRTRMALKGVDHPEAKWMRRFAVYGISSLMGFCGGAYFLSRTFVYPMFFYMAMLGTLPLVARPYFPPGTPPIFDIKKDVYRMVTLGTIGSVIYIYISIILLNKAYY